MDSEMDNTIKKVYRRWKAKLPKGSGFHPDEETFAAFMEHKLSPKEAERVRSHIITCEACSRLISDHIKLASVPEIELPQELKTRTEEMIQQELSASILEIILQLKDKALEIINTTGDVLVGQEFVPAAVLRSRQIKDFNEEVSILKDFAGIRVEAKIEVKDPGSFNVIIVAREKETQKIINDLRVSLIKRDVELESYLSSSGKVIFEHVSPGQYSVAITGIKETLATITIDMKV